MSDGVKLAVDVYLPSGGSGDGPFPVLLNYLPYHRALIDPYSGKIDVGYVVPGTEALVKLLTSNGYAVVIADMRGSGASFGSKFDMDPQIAKDGKELVDWIDEQPWCDGNVGMFGGSYHGWSQFAVAGQWPRALKAIMPEIMSFDMFSSAACSPGGIRASGGQRPPFQLMDLNAYIPTAGLLPAPPVVDEDGDGQIVDEIPVYPTGKNVFAYDPPTYSDGETRDDIYYYATLEHLDNLYAFDIFTEARYRDSEVAGSGFTYADLGPSDWPIQMAKSGVAIYGRSGWFDAYPHEIIRWFATMKATNPTKLLIHPGFHSIPDMSTTRGTGPYWSYFGEDINSAVNEILLPDRMRFFDRYLKGVKNGLDDEPPILIYVMNGGGWRLEDQWPLGRQKTSNYYFEKGNKLVTFKPSDRLGAGSDAYQVDLTHSSRYGTNNAGRWIPAPDKIMIRTDKDLKCLTYTSETLHQDTEVTGHPIVHLWVSSTADDGDFFVYLEDVDENGEAYYVTDGMLRAGFAKLVPNEEILPPGSHINVLPDLPWHGFKESDYVGNVFAGGKKMELVFDLLPTSWVFKKGHRIRVSIAGADWPTFDLNPKLSPTNKPNDPNNTIPTIAVHRGKAHLSRIELPVIPSKPTVFAGKARVKTRGYDYQGDAELYAFENAVYLYFDGQWIKWDTVNHHESKCVETFKCRGEEGKLTAVVQQKKNGVYSAIAHGHNIWFSSTYK
jgi:hypothetical protein